MKKRFEHICAVVAASELSSSLCRLLNISFTKGDQPQAWRDATISPVHKKGSKTLPTNYRPISLLSVASKVQEKIVHDRLYNHIDHHMPPHQSGFRKKVGTELQLLRLIHEVSENRDKGKAVVTCFFDLSKAFDRVWHKGLLAKLQHAGVCEASLTWFTIYLTRRRQRVRANSVLSQWQTNQRGAKRVCFGSPAFLNLHNRPPIQLHKPVHNLQPVCRRHSARHHQRVCWWRPAFPAGCCHLGSHLAHGLALTRECHKNRFNVISTAAAAADHNKWHIAAAGLLPPLPWPHHPGWLTVVRPCGRKNKKRLDASFSSCGVSATHSINQHWSVCIQSTYDQYWNMDHSCFPVCPRRLTTDWRASNGMLDVSAWVFLYSSLPTTALSSTTRHYLPSLPAVNTEN